MEQAFSNSTIEMSLGKLFNYTRSRIVLLRNNQKDIKMEQAGSYVSITVSLG